MLGLNLENEEMLIRKQKILFYLSNLSSMNMSSHIEQPYYLIVLDIKGDYIKKTKAEELMPVLLLLLVIEI